MSQEYKGHIAAIITIFIWGTTFISTKILLDVFTPIEILFMRFLLGYFVLWCVCPKQLKELHKKEEVYFILAGLCGVTLYYLFENIALTYTLASNVGVIISISPFFTIIFSRLLSDDKQSNNHFLLGFFIAIIGIMFISFGNGLNLEVNPLGDVLAVFAAIVWAIYSILTKKIGEFGYNVIQSTRRTFFYGLLFMIVPVLFMDFHIELSQFSSLTIISNILFLGIGASALCFVTWNFAVRKLGSVKTSVYIYMVPVITVITSVIILNEKMTLSILCGIVLTLVGLFLSENRKKN